MDIAFIIMNRTEFNTSSYNNQEIGKAKELVNSGNNVDIYVYSKKRVGIQNIYSNNNRYINIIPYKGITLGNQIIPLNLKKLLKTKNYSIAHIHEYPFLLSNIAAIELKKLGSIVILIQGMYYNFNGFIKTLYNRFYDTFLFSHLIKNLDGIIFKTESAKSYIMKKGINKLPMAVIPIGLDLEAFNESFPIPVNSELQEKILNFPKRLLFIGYLGKVKNPMFVLEILEKLLKKNKDYLLLIIGMGPLEKDLLEFVSEKQIDDHVILIPTLSQKQIAWIYQQFHLLILPSSFEIFGMVLLEALYFKLGILTTPTAGALEILKGVKYAYIKEINLDNWVETIEKYFSNSITKHVENQLYFENHFKWDKIVNLYLSFYNQLLNKKS